MALVVLMVPIIARANIGPPSSGGHIVAEPTGVIGVEVTHETLTIDLRPLAKNGLAQVVVVYQLHNPGEEKKLDLLFASGSAGMADFQVRLEDQPVDSEPVKGETLPTSWQAPKQTPGLHGESGVVYLRYHARGVIPMAFTLIVPPGRHNLEVRYRAEAATNLLGRPTVYRQFAYVLAPARAWSAFGGLDVTVLLPDGWRAACTPEMKRVADRLQGSFTDLPADSIALTVQASEGWAYWLIRGTSLVLFGLAGLGGAVWCFKGGWSKGKRLAVAGQTRANWLDRHAWPRSIVLGLVWGLSVLATGMFAIISPDWVLPADQATRYGYQQALAIFGVLFLSALALPMGFAIAHLTAAIVRLRELAHRGASGDENISRR